MGHEKLELIGQIYVICGAYHFDGQQDC